LAVAGGNCRPREPERSEVRAGSEGPFEAEASKIPLLLSALPLTPIPDLRFARARQIIHCHQQWVNYPPRSLGRGVRCGASAS